MHFSFKDTQKLKVKGWKNIFNRSENEKTVGVVILISAKIYFKQKTVARIKGGHYGKGVITSERYTNHKSVYIHPTSVQVSILNKY